MTFEEVKQAAETDFRKNMDAGFIPLVTYWGSEDQGRIAVLLPGSMSLAKKQEIADFIYDTLIAVAEVQEAA